MESKQSEVWFETTNGVRVHVKAVSDMVLTMVDAAVEREFRARGEPVDPPTYTVELAGGGTQEFEHDETSLEIKAEQTGLEDAAQAAEEAERQTEANREAWRLHLAARGGLAREKTERRMRAWFTGLDVEAPDDGWDRKQRSLGIEVPEDPDERRHHWIMTELLTTAEDGFKAVEACSKQTYRGMLKEEDIAAAVASFRDSVERAAPAPAGEGRDAVGVHQEAGGAEHGEGLGRDAAEQVRRPAVRGPAADGGGGPRGPVDAPGGGAGGRADPEVETAAPAAPTKRRKRKAPRPPAQEMRDGA